MAAQIVPFEPFCSLMVPFEINLPQRKGTRREIFGRPLGEDTDKDSIAAGFDAERIQYLDSSEAQLAAGGSTPSRGQWIRVGASLF